MSFQQFSVTCMVVKHLVNCTNPSWVYNKYTHERIFVDCGKCDACLNRRHERYVQAMIKEQKQHKYAFFCTLTYSDKYIPKLYRSKDGKSLYDPNPLYGFTMEIDPSTLCHRDMSYYRQKQYFEYARFSDFQRFLKRFRINAQRFLNNKYEKFVTTEQASTVLSPSVRIFTVYSSLTRTNSPRILEKYSIRVGRCIIDVPRSLIVSELNPSSGLCPNPIAQNAIPARIVTALLMFLHCIRLVKSNQDTVIQNSLLSDVHRLVRKKYGKLSIMERLDVISELILMENPLLTFFPVRLKVDSFPSVYDFLGSLIDIELYYMDCIKKSSK